MHEHSEAGLAVSREPSSTCCHTAHQSIPEQPVVTRRMDEAPTEEMWENAALRRERDAHKCP